MPNEDPIQYRFDVRDDTCMLFVACVDCRVVVIVIDPESAVQAGIAHAEALGHSNIRLVEVLGTADAHAEQAAAEAVAKARGRAPHN